MTFAHKAVYGQTGSGKSWLMKRLAKLGVTQSYTYFAWRNTARELEEYFTELTRTEAAHYFRPSAWPNTPDILTEQLQTGGRAAMKLCAGLEREAEFPVGIGHHAVCGAIHHYVYPGEGAASFVFDNLPGYHSLLGGSNAGGDRENTSKQKSDGFHFLKWL